ncbi:SGNH/GDSL hydrolase family protein [Demequina phytophila]|uniref:SGNH/GDSL hydrolase family protein n=1 Tax=Demequina phytophila TaxID=1638981 RepID=UPI000785E56A|nr:SGNH/GDSL hydrolase family protein [Demequina phytophila]
MAGLGGRRESWLTRTWAGLPVWAAIAFALVLAAVAALWLANSAASSRAAASASASPVDTAVRALFIGDSYTAGTGASSDATRWSTLVAADQGWEELNYGLGGTGYSSTSGFKGCGEEFCDKFAGTIEQAAADGVEPDVVVISGGQNDAGLWWQDSDAVIADVDATYQAARATFPHARIIAVGPHLPGQPYGHWKFDFDDAVQEAAESVDGEFVSLMAPRAVKFRLYDAGDGVHVNDEGHRLIAQRVIEGIQ